MQGIWFSTRLDGDDTLRIASEAPFIDLKSLNDHLLHAIGELEGLWLCGHGVPSSCGEHFWRFNNLLWGLFGPYCAEFPCRWSKDVPRFDG